MHKKTAFGIGQIWRGVLDDEEDDKSDQEWRFQILVRIEDHHNTVDHNARLARDFCCAPNIEKIGVAWLAVKIGVWPLQFHLFGGDGFEISEDQDILFRLEDKLARHEVTGGYWQRSSGVFVFTDGVPHRPIAKGGRRPSPLLKRNKRARAARSSK
jgi:hypothetical protein